MEKRQFTLRLDSDVFEKLKYISDKEKRSIAMQIEYITEKYIETYEKENGSIKINET